MYSNNQLRILNNNNINTYLLGGISVENSSISASARSTAFIPLVQRRLPQNTQLTWVTHLFLKLALDVDMAVPTCASQPFKGEMCSALDH